MSEKADLLRAAVVARAAYWDVERELEKALGFVDDVPDDAADYISDQIGMLATSVDSGDACTWIGDTVFAEFEKGLPRDNDPCE